ncbi:S8 family serine peptidase [Paenibacillus riograndensis]|uniref:Minor extracellular serine protease n=1 Tax=Paenibacillus riograndensis SBR5 TaxID=1073571 RepID=A0A0E4HEB3_9BACL|nr:S8 family serine peptidase [Paenibacillus riograndensis]CQR57619.1 minor extracellular serine protease [Paenibacillus riograndensis SBR5]
MEWTRLPRKLSILALSLGVTAGMIPGAAFAASSLQTPSTSNHLASLNPSNQTFISPQINTKSSINVRVIVQLSGQPAAVGKYAAKQGISALAKTATEAAVKSQQADVLDQAEAKGIDLTVNYKYDTILNGFEVTVPADKIPELAKISGVTSIYPNSTWYALPDQTVTETTYRNDNAPLTQIHADWAEAKGFNGAGLKVGVIDTGVDYKHPDIAAAYKGGYDSFYQDNDPYEEEPLTPAEDPYGVGYGGTSHGTHVSGTIIGQFAANGNTAQKGVAPGADLYVYKVLGRNLDKPSTSSGSSAQVIDGIEHAVKDGMDVINLSLGSDSEKDVNSPDSIAINNAVLSGVTAVIANGNNGEAGYFSLGSPAASQLAISVGSVTSPIDAYSGKFKAEIANSVTSVTYDTYFPFHIMAYELEKSDFASADIIGTDPVRVVYANLGADEDYPEGDLSKTIVLISRGDLTFQDKIANAKAHGVKALVIFNGNARKVDNKSEAILDESYTDRSGFIGINLGNGYQNVPTFDIKGSEGRKLARAIIANGDRPTYFTFGSEYQHEMTTGDTMSTFSSWGPNVDGNLSIKPDIVAPGDGVLSTYPAYGGDYSKAYQRSSGTSMATPHVAGLSLLIKQAHPEYTPFDIRAVLANTADPILYNKAPEDLYIQGPGRANVENAILTPALLEAVEPITILDKNYVAQSVTNYNPSTGFGVLTPGSKSSKTLQLKNLSSSDVAYTASVKWNYGDGKVTAALDKTTLTASAHGTTGFNLNVAVAPDANPEQPYQGNVILTAEGQPTLHLPFTVHVNDKAEQPDWGTGIQEAVISQPIVYSNASAVLNYQLKAKDINYYEVNLVGLDDVKRGSFQVSTTGSPDKFFAPGSYSTVIGATYHPYDLNGDPIVDANGNPAVANITDGVYKLEILGITAEDNTKTPIKIDLNNDTYYSTYTSFRYITVSSGGSGGGGGGGGGTVVTPSTPVVPSTVKSLVEAGAQQVTVTPVTSSKNGVTTVTVSDSDLKTALAKAAASKTAVVISVGTITDKAAELSLTADQVKLLAGIQAGSSVIVSISGSAVSLPVSLLAASPAGQSLKLVIKQEPDAASKLTANTAGSKVIGTPVSFEASWSTATSSTYLNVPNNVFIKRSFTVPGAIQNNTAGVLFEDNGLVTPVGSVFTPQTDGTTIVTVSRPGFSVYAAVSKPAAAFTDIASSKSADAIKTLADKLIIQGTSATTFSPQSNLTRAEFTALLTRALGLRTDANATFSDVKSSDWYAKDVAAASKAGLILGVGKGKFAPTQKVTRQELAVILDRALKLTGTELKAANPSFTTYTDSAKVAPYAKDSLQTLSQAGVIGSDVGNSFNPTAPATRETAAAALFSLLSKVGLI